MQPSTERKTITGYQYGDDKSLIGEYQFHNNEDKAAIHLPPNTTLKVPPKVVGTGKEAAFDEIAGDWYIRDEDLSWMDEATRTKMLEHIAVINKANAGPLTEGDAAHVALATASYPGGMAVI